MLTNPRGRGRLVSYRRAALRQAVRAGVTAAQLYTASRATAGTKRSYSAGKPQKRQKVVGRVGLADSGTARNVYKKRTASRKKKSLRTRVATLEKYKPKLAIKEYRNIDAQNIVCTANNCVYAEFNGITSSLLETAVQDVTFIDRAATPAVDTINLTDQTTKHDMDFRNLYSHVRFKNNNELTGILDVYCFICKDKSNSAPKTWMTNEDANFGVTNIDTNINTWPSDSKEMLKHWKMEKHTKAVLGPGDTLDVYWSRKRRIYDPKSKDSNGVAYQHGDQVWLFRLQGDITHGNTSDNTIGTGNPTIDYVVKRKVQLHYTAEAPFFKIETNNSMDTQSGGPEEAGPTVDAALVDN